MSAPAVAPVRALTDADFDAAIGQPGAVLVVFGAAWCQPCAEVDEALPGLASRLGKRCAVMRAELDDAQEAAVRARLRAVPLLALYRAGTLIATRPGKAKAEALAEWVTATLAAPPARTPD